MKKLQNAVTILTIILFIILGFKYLIWQNPIRMYVVRQNANELHEEYLNSGLSLIEENATDEEVLATAFSLLPKKVVDLLDQTEIKIYSTQEYIEAVTKYQKENNIYEKNNIINQSGGYTTPDSSIIFVNRDYGSCMTLVNLLHEIGHVVDNANYPELASQNFNFYKLLYLEKNYTYLQGSSYYDTTSEYFAEMFASLFLKDTPQYKLNSKFAPNTYKYIESVIDSL